MQNRSYFLFDLLLRKIRENYHWTYSLDELTNVVYLESIEGCFSLESCYLGKGLESEILDALIFLADNNLIILNDLTDECSIKISSLN